MQNKVQYTVRNIPLAIDRALRQQAKRYNKSLNQVAQEALAKGVGMGSETHEYHDLDHLIGSWIDDPAITRALAEQRTIDKELWR